MKWGRGWPTFVDSEEVVSGKLTWISSEQGVITWFLDGEMIPHEQGWELYEETYGKTVHENPHVKEASPWDHQEGGSHYTDMVIQPSEYITKNKLDWFSGQAIRYISRHGRKDDAIKDLDKAIHCLQLRKWELTHGS